MPKNKKAKPRARTTKDKVKPGIKAPKAPEIKYRKELSRLVQNMNADIKTFLVPALFALERQYIADSYIDDFSTIIDRLKEKYDNMGAQSRLVSLSFVADVSLSNSRRFEKVMNDLIGVDLGGALKAENLDNILKATVKSNVGLIETISEEYFKEIEQIVYNGTTRGGNANSMIDQILGFKQKDGTKTTSAKAFNRAKLIARDQTSKLNSAISQERQQSIGIVEYRWITSGDGNRVRETHRANHNKIFRWDSPPPTGHPGDDYQCRCHAEPVFNI